MSTLTLNIVPDPFKPDVIIEKEVPFVEGQPLSKYMEGIDIIKGVTPFYAINTTPVKPNEDPIPELGDKIFITARVEGAFIVAFIQWVGLVFAEYSLAMGIPISAAAAYTVGYVVATAAVVYGMSVIVKALMPSLEEPDTTSTKKANIWTPQTNPVMEGGPIPILYGKTKVTPQILNGYIAIGDDTTKQTLHLLFGICNGPITAITDVRFNDQPYTYFKDVTVTTDRLGGLNDTVIPGFNQLVTTNSGFTPAKTMTQNSPLTVQTNGDVVQKLELDIVAPGGLAYSNNQGELDTVTIYFNVEYRLVGGEWSAPTGYAISGATVDTVRKKITIDGLTPGQYEVRVTRTTANSSDYRRKDDTYWGSMREIVKYALTYPGLAKLGVQALATDQLSGSRPTVTCIAERATVSLGGLGSKTASNPAWACYDLLYNVRGIPAAEIDTTAFTTWASTCSETVEGGPRYEVNIFINETGSFWDTLQSIAKIGRATILRRGKMYTVIEDKPNINHTHLFTMGNIKKGSFNLKYLPLKDRANIIEASYIDEERDYTPQVVTVYGADYETDNQLSRKASIQAFGVTNRLQIIRECAYLLNSNKYLVRTVSFDATIDSFRCLVGDVFAFQHETPNYEDGVSGRLESAWNDTVGFFELPKEVTLEAGVSYAVMVLMEDDSVVEMACKVYGTETETDTIELQSAWTNVPAANCVFAFGKVATYIRKYRLVNSSRKDDLTMTIEGIQYVQEVYSDTGHVYDPPSFDDYTQTATNVQLSESLAYASDKSIVSTIVVSWFPAYNPSGFTWFIWYEDLTAGTDPVLAGTTDRLTYRIESNTFITGHQYKVYVSTKDQGPVAIVHQGGYNMATITLQGKLAPPSDLSSTNTSLNAVWDSSYRVVRFAWNHITDIDREFYEIRYGVSWNTGTIIGREITDNTFTWPIPEGTIQTYTFWIKAIDTSKIYSENALSSDSISVNTGDCPLTTPTINDPTSVAYISSDGTSLVNLTVTWDALAEMSDEFAYYELELILESVAGGTPINRAIYNSSKENEHTWLVHPNSQYKVRVRAYDISKSCTPWSTQKSITTAKDNIAPKSPVWPSTGSIIPGFKMMGVRWEPVTQDANDAECKDLACYEIRRSPDGSNNWEIIGSPRANYFLDNKLTFNQGTVVGDFYYQVRAVDTSGNTSDWSSTKGGTTLEVGTTDIAANAIIAEHIQAEAIEAAHLKSNEVFTNTIQSSDWDPVAETGWQINAITGVATFYDMTFEIGQGSGTLPWGSLSGVPETQIMNNLIDPTDWVLGTSGSQPKFTEKTSGGAVNNIVEAEGPYGGLMKCWECTPSTSDSACDGGWHTDNFTIDPTKTYRFATFFKMTGTTEGDDCGRIYLGLAGNTVRVPSSGALSSNPYFMSGFRYSEGLELDEWYLVVGYVHPYNHTGTTNSTYGIYKLSTGEKITTKATIIWKWAASDTEYTYHRNTYYYNNNTSSDNKVLFVNPRVEVIDGTEPSVMSLLNAFQWDDIKGTYKPEDGADVTPKLPSDENLLGYWPLTEPSGTIAVDGSGNGNDGTLTGTSFARVSGVAGQALSLGGTNERVHIDNAAPLSNILNNEAFWISVWFKGGTQTEDARIFTKYVDANNKIEVFTTAASQDIRFTCKKNGVGLWGAFTAWQPFDDEWHHLVLVFDLPNDIAYGYLDTIKGSNTGTMADNPDDSSNAGAVLWGSSLAGAKPLDGELQHGRLYKGTPTESEIKALFLNPSGNPSTVIPWTAMTGTDNIIRTFYSSTEPTSGMDTGDYWIDSDTGQSYRYNGSAWIQVQDEDIAQALSDAASAQSTADGKITTFIQAIEPTAEGTGDLWFDSDNGYKPYRWNGTSWVTIQDASIATAQADATQAINDAATKIKTYYQNTEPTDQDTGDLWLEPSTGILRRWYNDTEWRVVSTFSTGENLLINGDASLGDTFGMDDDFDYHATGGVQGTSHFSVTSGAIVCMSTIDIPINPANAFEIEGWFKTASLPNRFFAGVACLDKDGNNIAPQNCYRFEDSDTTLYEATTGSNHVIKIVPPTYDWNNNQDSLVVQFDIETDYSDLPNFSFKSIDLDKDDEGYTNGINKSNHPNYWEVWLKADAPAYSAGTGVGLGKAGATYNYCLASNSDCAETNTWEQRTAIIQGINGVNQYPGIGVFRIGTTTLRFLLLPNRDGTNTLNIDGMVIRNLGDKLAGIEEGATVNHVYHQDEPPTEGMVAGDIWIDTNDGNRMYHYSGSAWQDIQDTAIATAQATADGKVVTFIQDSAPTAEGVGDLWIDSNDDNKLYRWSGSAWVIIRDAGIAQAISDAYNAQTTADGKITTFYSDSAPTSGMEEGDLWIDTNDDMRPYYYTGSAWTDIGFDVADWSKVFGAGKPEDGADVTPKLPSDEHLLAQWSFNETTGQIAYDGSGNGYNLALQNTLDTDWVNGVAGKCINLDGVNKYGITTTSFGTLSGDTTMCGWFNIDSYVLWSGIGCLTIDGSDYKGWMVTLVSATSIRICAGKPEGGVYAQHTFTVPAMSGDSFIFIRHVSNVFYVYVDGDYVGSWSQQVAYNTTAGDFFQVGRWRYDYNNYYMDGRIDEVRFYKTGLSASEGKALFLNPAGAPSITMPWNNITGAGQRVQLYQQNSFPTSGMGTGDVLIHTGEDNKLYRYYDGAWHSARDGLIETVNNLIEGKTVIQNGYIATGLVVAESIAAGTINADHIEAGSITVDEIQTSLMGDLNQAMYFVKKVLSAGDEYQHTLTTTDLDNATLTNLSYEVYIDYGTSLRVSTVNKWDDPTINWDDGTAWDNPHAYPATFNSNSVDLGASKTLQLSFLANIYEQYAPATDIVVEAIYSSDNSSWGTNQGSLNDNIWETLTQSDFASKHKWTGTLMTFRYFKIKVTITSTDNSKDFILYNMEYQGNIVNTYGYKQNVYISSTGTTIRVSGYNSEPALVATVMGSGQIRFPNIYSVTNVGGGEWDFTLRIYNYQGFQCAGWVNMIIMGV